MQTRTLNTRNIKKGTSVTKCSCIAYHALGLDCCSNNFFNLALFIFTKILRHWLKQKNQN